MSDVLIKEEQEGLPLALVEMNAEETAGAAVQTMPCSVLPTGQHPSVPAAVCSTNNDVQHFVNPIMQGDANQLPVTYYYANYPNYVMQPGDTYAFQQLPLPNAGTGLPQGGGYTYATPMPRPQPSSAPLRGRSAADNDQSKRAQRLMKNRLAAKQSRARKKGIQEQMKNRHDAMEAEIRELKEKLQQASKFTYSTQIYAMRQ